MNECQPKLLGASSIQFPVEIGYYARRVGFEPPSLETREQIAIACVTDGFATTPKRNA